MDTLYRQGKYQDLVKKLSLLQSTEDYDSNINAKHELLQQEVNNLIESLRHRGDQSNAKIHYIVLGIPLLIVLAWHGYTFETYKINIIIIILGLSALAYAHYRMNQVIRVSQENAPTKVQSEGNTKAFILTKMTYLNKAIDIKKSRLLLVSLFYILFFPILLVQLHNIAMSSIPFESPQMAYGIAYLLAAVLWYFYFNRAFEVYEEINQSLELIEGNL